MQHEIFELHVKIENVKCEPSSSLIVTSPHSKTSTRLCLKLIAFYDKH